MVEKEMVEKEMFLNVQKGHLGQVRKLIRKCPHVAICAKNHLGRTLLDEAIIWQMLEVAKFLWKQGVTINPEIYVGHKEYTSPLIIATVRYRDRAMLEWILENHVVSDAQLLQVDKHRRGIIDISIEHALKEHVCLLRKHGIHPNPDLYRNGCFSPIHFLTFIGNAEMLGWTFMTHVVPIQAMFSLDHHGKSVHDIADKAAREQTKDIVGLLTVRRCRILFEVEKIFTSGKKNPSSPFFGMHVKLEYALTGFP